ncbi:hypothetical protein GCM10007989_07780 [Devosia pacifica]|uniref:Uncharacterized protein n=1 Tax=Devosia pacifica TaxID=1335967 RepID=A0A918RWQ1_9HYPH|nr:hypothetical protein [Devosia pacifica]GHA15450.1 hypothetical protein GCM10007989_07780 [Devosia pacifica]
MTRLTPIEHELLFLIRENGGSVCPGNPEFLRNAKLRRTLRRLEHAGILRAEDTDDGPRFHLTERGRQEVENG